MDNFVVISGCSGGGKTTLLNELKRRGHLVIEEPGRRIVSQEMKSGGKALPWVDMEAFAQRAITMSLSDREAAMGAQSWVFFDRGLIDAVAALDHATGKPAQKELARYSYNPSVFIAPPWPEIFVQDVERRHGLEEAIAEYERLLMAYSSFGYRRVVLPKTGVSERVDLILEHLESL